VSTFPKVPDAPVSRFDMRLKGGKGGILTVATRARRGICVRRRQISRAVFTGHNGKRKVQRVKMAKPCPRRPRR
ncbi:MAG: hypothetical protein M3N56_03640, partial [Actinomycetota bacterium]|nr:hypothetical protein [Actinomycetota bacterium]